MYNTTNLTAANNALEIVSAVNELSSGMLFGIGLFILVIVYMAATKKQRFKDVLFVGAFFISVVSIILFTMGLIGYQLVIGSIILFFAALMILYFVQ